MFDSPDQARWPPDQLSHRSPFPKVKRKSGPGVFSFASFFYLQAFARVLLPRHMSKVYIVINGEQYAGSTVVSVHKTLDGAVAAALQVPCCFDGGWIPNGKLWWKNGCDYLAVLEKDLLEE